MLQVALTFSPPFRSLAEGELCRQGFVSPQLLAPDLFLARFPGLYDELTRQWRRRPPIYFRHMFPVQTHGCRPQALLNWLRPQEIAGRAQVRCLDFCDYGLEEYWEDRLNRRLRSDGPEVLSVVLREDRFWAGLSAPECNLSPWKGGAPTFEADWGLVNRAEWKLREALQVFGLRLQPRWRALDLGAAPGGWSRVLLRQGLHVTAVDPRPVKLEHPRLAVHCRTFEEFAPGQAGFDLITNDMMLPPEQSAQKMVEAAAWLRPGGMGLITLKLGSLSLEQESRRGHLRRSLNILRRAYRIPRLRQLFYNRFEVTAWLFKA